MQRWKRWRAAAIAILGFCTAAAIHGGFHAVGVPSVRPVPAVAMLPWLLTVAAILAALVSMVLVWRRQTRWPRRVGTVLGHLMLILAGASGAIAADPDFPFGPSHVDSLDLPGHGGTAHLYRGGLLCSQTVWIAGPGSWLSQPAPYTHRYSCRVSGTLTWDTASGRVHVVDADGVPVPRPASWGSAFHWGPH